MNQLTPPLRPLPRTVAHADWGVRPEKRWRATATLGPGGVYVADAPALVGRSGTPLERMGVAGGEPAVLGFDFPIGVPRRYAERAGIASFREALPMFGTGSWESFFDVADDPGDVSLHRPFYPMTSGRKGQHTRAAHLAALDFEASDLLRRCDHATQTSRAANALFWTLGGNQVGKGALSGWREVVIPALGEDDVALWPFDGTLRDLVGRRRIVLLETYPAAFYPHLGVVFGTKGDDGRSGKRRRHDRLVQAPRLLQAADAFGVRLNDELRAAIDDGFGDRADGEDRFDAVVGLIGMVGAIVGRIADEAPYDDRAVARVEGWMLGRAPGHAIP